MIPKKVLFCTDFSEFSRHAGRVATEYAAAFGAELMLLHVIDSPKIGYPSMEQPIPGEIRESLDKIRGSADKALRLLAEESGKEVDRVETHCRVGVPSKEIVRFAQKHSVELIVMGTHGLSGFRHLIMGSTAESVTRAAECPVLTVKSPK